MEGVDATVYTALIGCPVLVSIVTPCLNAARWLGETLASVREQDHAQVEHIVVDGGSTDGTLDLLRAAPGVDWTTGRDASMYDAINRGFRRARGEVLAYQNADDRYAGPDAVARAVALFEAHPEADVVYGGFRFVDEEGRMLEEPPLPEFDLALLARCNFVPPHSTFVRRRVVHDEGFWLDPTLRYAGDWEWFLRMAQAGKRFVRLPAVVSEFRRHAAGASATIGWSALLAEWWRICRARRVSFPRLVWHEAFYGPWRRRTATASAARAPRRS
jgi:glycosyltransferase involved in cell wall biosynthesis